MNIILTVNDKSEAMLLHDGQLGFQPSWVEFSRDPRGVRIISNCGNELAAGVLVNLVEWQQLDNVHEILVVRMQDQKAMEGFHVPFVSQHYDRHAHGRQGRHA